MLKKEFREIIVPALVRLSFLLIFPLISLTGAGEYLWGYFFFLSMILGFILLWIASTYGMDAFKNEHRDQALEYLLSFPYSKFKIVWVKLLPRMAILLLLILANLVVDFVGLARWFKGEGFGFYFLTFLSLFSLVLFFLLSGFFVSMFFEKKKSRIYVTFAAFFSLMAVSLGIHSLLMSSPLIRHLYDISFLVGCVVVLIPMSIAFVSVYRRFDLKSAEVHGRRFLLRALPPMAVLTAAGVFVFIKYGV